MCRGHLIQQCFEKIIEMFHMNVPQRKVGGDLHVCFYSEQSSFSDIRNLEEFHCVKKKRAIRSRTPTIPDLSDNTASRTIIYLFNYS